MNIVQSSILIHFLFQGVSVMTRAFMKKGALNVCVDQQLDTAQCGIHVAYAEVIRREQILCVGAPAQTLANHLRRRK